MAKCYDRYGNEVTDQIPCSQDGEPAQCCAVSDICATNGLCITTRSGTVTKYFINGCTDQGWANGSTSTCPTECLSSGGNGVVPCGYSGTFCCYGLSGCDCNNSTQTFSLGQVTTVLSTTASSTTSSITSTTTTGVLPTLTSSPPIAAADSNGNLRVPLGVGLGVGIPVSVAIIGALWFLRSRRASVKSSGNALHSSQAGSDKPGASDPKTHKHVSLSERVAELYELPTNRAAHELY